MGMTATQLGRGFFNRTAAEMNRLLEAHGFLEGGPSAWRPTELGKAFSTWVDKDNGYGGYAHREWSWLSWNDEVVEALKSSITAHPDGLPKPPPVAPVAAAAVVAAPVAARHAGGLVRLLGRNKWALAAVGIAGLVAATPPVRRLFQQQAAPVPATDTERDEADPGTATDKPFGEGDEPADPSA